MAGVLIYADDHIFTQERPEKFLYEKLREEMPVFGIERIDHVEQTTNSIGSFRAIILDWQFSDEEDFADLEEELGLKSPISLGAIRENETFKFLKEKDFYSLIYVFSQIEIENSEIGEKLKEKFGPRIKFKVKDENFTENNIERIKNDILTEIKDWEDKNKYLSAPIRWIESINKGIQQVFSDLSQANNYWIKHLYSSADEDGVDPGIFIVELLQLLLTEKLIQDNILINAIKEEGTRNEDSIELIEENDYDKSISKLFSILYYSKLTESTPIMTGDIVEVNNEEYGVIITPECDIRHVINQPELHFEILLFSQKGFKEFLKKSQSYSKDVDDYSKINEKRKKKLREMFNQNESRIHLLPSIPNNENYNNSAIIDFRLSSRKVLSSVLVEMKREYKINSPFIQQLRQRYLAYLGRVGVPSLPNNVRDWNLK